MQYNIRWQYRGTVHEIFSRELEAAKIACLCLIGRGFQAELWLGAKKLTI